jgi:hypothetical protein
MEEKNKYRCKDCKQMTVDEAKAKYYNFREDLMRCQECEDNTPKNRAWAPWRRMSDD